MAEFIEKTDTLNEGREKLNAAIQDAEDAKNISVEADEKATQALANSESTQTQLDTIVIDGDSSVEAAQARVDTKNHVYDTLKQRLDTEYTEVTSQLADTVDDLINRSINVKLPFGTNLTPAKGDGTTDDTAALQAIIDYAKSKNIPVFLPTGMYLVSDTLILYRSSFLFGTLNSVWAGSAGVEIVSLVKDDKPTISFSEPSVIIKNISIRGTLDCRGILAEDGAYDFAFENVKIKGCRINFDIGYAWTYTLLKCRTEGGEIGFDVKGATSASFISCVAFNSSDAGIKATGLIYTNFVGCGTDGCSNGLELYETARGVTFSSFGVENATESCIKVEGQNIAVTFTALTLGNHSDKEIKMIQIVTGLVTFTDLRLSQQVSPQPPGKILDIVDGVVTLINPHLPATHVGDIEKCTVIGGFSQQSENPLYHSRFKRPLNIPLAYSYSGTTPVLESNENTSILFTVGANETYILSAVTTDSGPQQCHQILYVNGGGTGVVHDIIEKNAVEFYVVGDNVRIRNLSQSNKSYNWSAIRIR